MAEPPAKRARRMDSSAMWEQNNFSEKPDKPRQQSSRKDASKSDHRDRRQRSRSRERAEETRNPGELSSAKERRSGRDRDRKPRERSRSRDRQKHRREDRQRSRSPHRDSSRRSPPRGPRAHRTRSRERHNAPPNGVEPTRKPNQLDTSSRGQARVEKAAPNGTTSSAMEVDGAAGDVPEDELQAQMQAVMGFRGFKTTKNTKVAGNDKLYGVRKEKKTEYRQYMNRVGGFNRPLSPSHE